MGCNRTPKLRCGGDKKGSHLKYTRIKFGWLIFISTRVHIILSKCIEIRKNLLYSSQLYLKAIKSGTVAEGTKGEPKSAFRYFGIKRSKNLEQVMEVWIFSKPKPLSNKIKRAWVSVLNSFQNSGWFIHLLF